MKTDEIVNAAYALRLSGLEKSDISAKAPTQDAIQRIALDLSASLYSRVRIQGGVALETYYSMLATIENVLVSISFARPSIAGDANIPGWDVGENRISTREEVRAAVGAPSLAPTRPIESVDVVEWVRQNQKFGNDTISYDRVSRGAK